MRPLDSRRCEVVEAIAKSVSHLCWLEGAVEVVVADHHRSEEDDLLVPWEGVTLTDGFQVEQLVLREHRGGG